MSDMTPEKAQELLDRHALFEQGKESMVLSVSETVDFARAYIAQAAELARLRAQMDDWRASQHYRYIGADGKAVKARDLEDELARLRAKVDAADKLAEALADAAGALDGAGEELSDFANILSRDPWQANHAYESAVRARSAIAAYQEAGR